MPRYRPPSSEPRGKWARAIHAKRRAEQISQTAAFEVLGPRLGLGPKSRSAYIALDMGEREPSEAEANVLAEWLGSYPVEEPHTAGAVPHTSEPVSAALVSALEAQTQALRDQTAAFIALAASIDRAASSVTGRVGEFGDLLGDLVQLMRPPSTEPVVPPVVDEHRASNHQGR